MATLSELPKLDFGYFHEELLGNPSVIMTQGQYQSAIWYPLPSCVDHFITSDSERVRSWKPFGPPKSTIAYVQITHYDMTGQPVTGELVIDSELAEEVSEIANKIFQAEFPIESHRLIDYWDADDEASMSCNNSSALCVRAITGGGQLSKHALGRAWDINPRTNPYHNIVKGIVAPANGKQYLDRTQAQVCPGMIVEGDPVVSAFDEHGWVWGGTLDR